MEFAQVVKDQKNLDALMLLTLADGQGTSAEAWSDWKESLVWQLFHQTSRYLADRKSYYEQTRIARETLRSSVAENLSPDYAEEIEAHFEYMPDHYFRATSVPEIIEHVKLFRSFLESVSSPPRDGFAAANAKEVPLAPAVRWKIVPEQGHTVMTFCTWDRERLLAKIAGSLSVVPLNILSADVFPRGDSTVLGVFRVCDTKAQPVSNPRDFELVEQTLRRAFGDESFDFVPSIEKAKRSSRPAAVGIEFPTRITIDNKTHPTYTLVEFQAPDRIGLLYDVLSCLDRENVLVPLSRINTQAGAAIDTLYVVDGSSHAKITDSQRIRTVQQHLKDTILRGSPKP
jgi:[protein-PII] uridylyltransferase